MYICSDLRVTSCLRRLVVASLVASATVGSAACSSSNSGAGGGNGDGSGAGGVDASSANDAATGDRGDSGAGGAADATTDAGSGPGSDNGSGSTSLGDGVSTVSGAYYQPTAMLVADGYVYWSDAGGCTFGVACGAIRRAPVTGGDAVDIATNLGGIGQFLFADGVLYFIDGGVFSLLPDASAPTESLKSIALSGAGPFTVTTLAANIDPVGNLNPMALDATNIYWSAGVDTFHSVPRAGGSVQTIPVTIPVADSGAPNSNATTVSGLAVSGGMLVFTTLQPANFWSVPITGGTATPLGEAGTFFESIAVTSTTIYGGGYGSVASVPIGGATTVASPISGPEYETHLFTHLLVDATAIYWSAQVLNGTSPPSFEVGSNPIAGGASPIYVSQPESSPVAIDDSSVYWWDSTLKKIVHTNK